MGRKAKRPQEKGAEATSYSFTEPVVRVIKDKAKVKPGSSHKKPASCGQNSSTETRLAIFHKKKDKYRDADVLGARYLSKWRKFSGRSKSWKNCKRFKITQDELEMLTSSNGHPVSFGWEFSATTVPASFVRGRGLHLNKKSKPRRTTTLSSFQAFDDSYLDEEYTLNFPQTRCLPQQFWRTRGEILAQKAIPTKTVDSKIEASLKEVKLTALQPAPIPGKESQSDIVPKSFVLRELLCKESFADVYLVQDTQNHSAKYHAHAFSSDGLSGKGSAYVRRKMGRLRKSHDFHAEAVGFGRKILVMKAALQTQDIGPVNLQRNFPALPGTVGKSSQKTGLRKNRRSYAAVVAQIRPLKMVVKPNNVAYAAWQERHRTEKPKKEKVATG